jgi:hypothetical protein
MSTSTQQEKKKGNPNPSPSTRFGAENGNPQNPGGWKKEESISYQYNRFGRMSDEELDNYIPKTQFERIALNRIKAAKDLKYGLPDSKEVTDRTEGKAPQSIDVTTGGDKLNIALVEFIDGTYKDEDTNTT